MFACMYYKNGPIKTFNRKTPQSHQNTQTFKTSNILKIIKTKKQQINYYDWSVSLYYIIIIIKKTECRALNSCLT